MWVSKPYVSTAFKSTCSYKNRNRGRCCYFNTVRDAPAGSPLSRVSTIMLVPSHIRPNPSKRSPHPSVRGGAHRRVFARLLAVHLLNLFMPFNLRRVCRSPQGRICVSMAKQDRDEFRNNDGDEDELHQLIDALSHVSSSSTN